MALPRSVRAVTRRNQRPHSGSLPGSPACGRLAVTGWRWPISVTLGLKPRLQHVAQRRRRQDGAERRAVERALRGEHRPDRDQQRAAALHVFGDVAEIVARDQAARLVAVEDDEVEFLQLLLEQLAHREDDQAELAHRREIVLLRRAQDGESAPGRPAGSLFSRFRHARSPW